jgi:hypothetical protein
MTVLTPFPEDGSHFTQSTRPVCPTIVATILASCARCRQGSLSFPFIQLLHIEHICIGNEQKINTRLTATL